MKFLLIGGTGRTGREIARLALLAGHQISAIVHDIAKAQSVLPGVELVEGDARDATALAKAMIGCAAVANALGSGVTLFREVTLFSESTQALIEAMRAQQVKRLVCITGIGAGDSRGHGGFVFDRLVLPLLLRTVYDDKNRQEALIRASDLDWTIVRPTELSKDAGRRHWRVLTDLADYHGGKIARTDVAAFMVEQLGSDRYLRQTPLITW
jgi:uncharacterized protein YbjT (DUF2867 family)